MEYFVDQSRVSLDFDDLFKLWGYKDYANIFVNLSKGFL